jgi:hypothetical protein
MVILVIHAIYQIEEAKRQAKFEFDINSDDWKVYSPNES